MLARASLRYQNKYNLFIYSDKFKFVDKINVFKNISSIEAIQGELL